MRRLLISLVLLVSGAAWAGEADVVDVKVRRVSPGVYNFDVTVKSNDTGWSHYADAFEVLGPDGKVLGQRILFHPHETEQPFTRDLYGVHIPPGVRVVVIQGRDQRHGWGGGTIEVALPGR